MASDERLAFSFGHPAVPARPPALAAPADPTFATTPYSEPRDWGYSGLLAFTALLLLRPQDLVPALEPLHLPELCALIGIGPMLIHRFVRRLPVFRVTAETVALAGFGVVLLASALFSIWPGGSIEVFMNSYVKVFIVFVLMMNTLTTARRIEQFTWLILVCCGIVAALAVMNYVRGENLVEGGRLAGPVSGMFGNPNDLALNFVTFLPVAAVVAMSGRFSAPRRVLALGFFGLMLATIVFTKSRGGTLGLAVTLLAVIVMTRTVRPAFGAAILAAVLLATPFLPSTFWARMATMFDQEQDALEFTGSSEARWVVMQEGIEAFLARPLTGVGAGQFKNYAPEARQEPWREAHNVLIQVAADTGILGLLLFGFLVGRAGLTAVTLHRQLGRRHRRRGPTPAARVLTGDERETLHLLAIASSAGLLGWFTCAMFASVAYSWTFYYLLALIVASRELVRDRLAAGVRADEPTVQVRARRPRLLRRRPVEEFA